MKMSSDSGENSEVSTQRNYSHKNEGDFACFGEYGKRTACSECPNKMTCQNFTHAKETNIYRKKKGKYGHRGKWSRKDLY